MNHDLIICGGGPAGTGLFVHAMRHNALDAFLAPGVLLVERSAQLGAGSLAHYRIEANSLGGAFLEALDDDAVDPRLAALRDHPSAAAVLALAGTTPPLPVVGEYLRELGTVVGEAISAHPGGDVRLGTRVDAIRLLPAGGAQVRMVDEATGAADTATARTVVVATGGRPRPLDRIELRDDLGLRDYLGKSVHSSAVIDRRAELPALGPNARVVVVGGAHSAWSVAHLLLKEEVLGERPHVTVLHRSPLRLFYTSTDLAAADGYPFDTEDVCPLSGRVNRYSGLRGRAKDLAARTLGLAGSRPATLDVLPITRDAPRRTYTDVLESADLVVAATGFDGAVPPVTGRDGEPLRLLTTADGHAVDAEGHLVDEAGRSVPELVAFGLGCGLRVSTAVGGEPRFRGRADGVWLYQHDVASVITSTLRRPATV